MECADVLAHAASSSALEYRRWKTLGVNLMSEENTLVQTWPLAFGLAGCTSTLARLGNSQVLVHSNNSAVSAFFEALHHLPLHNTYPFICSSCCLMLSGSHDASTPKLRNIVWEKVVLLGLLCATVRRCTPLTTCSRMHGERSRIDITTADSTSAYRCWQR